MTPQSQYSMDLAFIYSLDWDFAVESKNIRELSGQARVII
jgi:hypothetical protein